MENEKTALGTVVNENMLPLAQQAEIMQHRLAIADKFHKAGCFGGDVKNPFQAMVKIQAGAEMGMPPMESMQSLYIVNGKVTMYGTALSKRIKEAGYSIKYEDGDHKCTVTVSKGKDLFSESVDGKTDKVLQKSKAYTFAPLEKMRWHCLARLVRFHIPEILGGVIQYMKEEAEEFERDVVEVVEDISEPERPVLEGQTSIADELGY